MTPALYQRREMHVQMLDQANQVLYEGFYQIRPAFFDYSDYGNFSTTIGQEEGIKNKNKIPKIQHRNKILYTTK